MLVQMHAEIQIQSSTYFCERTRFFVVKEMAIEDKFPYSGVHLPCPNEENEKTG